MEKISLYKNFQKESFAVYCKTYGKDLKRFERLVKSFNKFNKDDIKFFASVPEEDFELFKGFGIGNIHILTDESFAKEYFETEKRSKYSIGYINQEICKLSFFETGYAENYFCVDSDAEFIRDFYKKDFMADDKTPYTVLIQDKELGVEKFYKKFSAYRAENIKKIFETVELDDRRFRTCHGMQVLNAAVLKSLKEDFMMQNGYSYKDLINISPFEFTWYNAWFQKCKLIPEVAVEPFFKTFHSRVEYHFARFRGIKLEDYARQYVGIILNGNWKRPVEHYKNPNVFHSFVYFVLKKIL